MSLREIFDNTTTADRILFSVLILMSVSGFFSIREVLPESLTVQIEVDGHPVYILPLDKSKTVSVKGPEGITIIEIKDHKVRVTDSPCNNKLCMQQGWLESGAIVCLPNRVIVTIGNHDKNHKTFDATTG